MRMFARGSTSEPPLVRLQGSSMIRVRHLKNVVIFRFASCSRWDSEAAINISGFNGARLPPPLGDIAFVKLEPVCIYTKR